MILALALAAAIAAQGVPQLSYGPFRIEVSSEDVVGFPLTTVVKMTKMTWTSRSGLVTFALSDDGDEIRATAEAGPPEKRCQFRSNPLQFDMPSKALFRVATKEASMACLDAFDRELQVATRRDIEAAAKEFPGALALFRTETIKQHGPSVRRCVKYVFGNHGSICERHTPDGT